MNLNIGENRVWQLWFKAKFTTLLMIGVEVSSEMFVVGDFWVMIVDPNFFGNWRSNSSPRSEGMTSERGITFDGTNPAPPGMYKNLANHGIIYTIPHYQLVSLAGFLLAINQPLSSPPGQTWQERQPHQQRLQVKESELQRCYKTLGPGTLCSSAFWWFLLLKTGGLGLGVFVSTCTECWVATRKYQKIYCHIQGGPQKPVIG